MKAHDKADRRFKMLLAVAAVLVMLAVLGIILLGSYWMNVRHAGEDGPQTNPQGRPYKY